MIAPQSERNSLANVGAKLDNSLRSNANRVEPAHARKAHLEGSGPSS